MGCGTAVQTPLKSHPWMPTVLISFGSESFRGLHQIELAPFEPRLGYRPSVVQFSDFTAFGIL